MLDRLDRPKQQQLFIIGFLEHTTMHEDPECGTRGLWLTFSTNFDGCTAHCACAWATAMSASFLRDGRCILAHLTALSRWCCRVIRVAGSGISVLSAIITV